MSRNARAALIALAAVVLAGTFVVLRATVADDRPSASALQPAASTATRSEPHKPAPSRPALPTIVVRDGRPVGGVRRLTAEAGGEVVFRVRSDAADELHVHGYDVVRSLPAGRARRIRFPAGLEGRFDVELHHGGALIAQLEVHP